MIAERVAQLLDAHALLIAGEVRDKSAAILLIAPDTRRFWPLLSRQPEAMDGKPDRVDRWSRRVLSHVATEIGAEALFPFDGPPWHPFMAWAIESGRAWSSPVGPLVHDRMGLWVSFRGALRVPHQTATTSEGVQPCRECTKPCQSACPVGAMGQGDYDVIACRTHVASPGGATCRSGCLVRKACPIGVDFALHPDQAAHHMRAFIGQRP